MHGIPHGVVLRRGCSARWVRVDMEKEIGMCRMTIRRLDAVPSDDGNNQMPNVQDTTSIELDIRRLSAGYRGRGNVLDDISLHFTGPGLYRLDAPNGTGKSTLFEVLSGFLPVHGGDMSLNGAPLTPARQLQHVTLVRTQPQLVPYMTVRDNVLLCASRFGSDLSAALGRAREFGLAPHMRKIPSELSTGTLRKAWLVCALQSDRPVLLLDEPFDGLDAEASDLLIDWMTSLSRNRLVILITHIVPQGLRTVGAGDAHA